MWEPISGRAYGRAAPRAGLLGGRRADQAVRWPTGWPTRPRPTAGCPSTASSRASASVPGLPPPVPAWAVGHARPPNQHSGSGSAGWPGCRGCWATGSRRAGRGPGGGLCSDAPRRAARTGMGIYGWEKLVCGLVDTAVYGGYDAGPDAPVEDRPGRVVRRDAPRPHGQRFRRCQPGVHAGVVHPAREPLPGLTWPAGTTPWPSSPGSGITTPTGTVLPDRSGRPSHGTSRCGCTPTATSTPCPARRPSTTFTTSPATSRSCRTPTTGWSRPSATPPEVTARAS